MNQRIFFRLCKTGRYTDKPGFKNIIFSEIFSFYLKIEIEIDCSFDSSEE